nr:NAD(P)H-binding protein [Micromonospora sp. DSM 115978]
MTRHAARLRDVPWAADAEVVEADVLDPAAVERALDGVDAAYYLIHSIDSGTDFSDTDRRAATTFAEAAKRAGVQRLIYLGGLGPEHGDSSEHLTSRREVGTILLDSGVPTAVLQAAVVVGSGSAS